MEKMFFYTTISIFFIKDLLKKKNKKKINENFENDIILRKKDTKLKL